VSSRRGAWLLVAFTVLAAVAVGAAWWGRTSPPPPPRPATTASPPDGVAGRPPTPAGSRDETLDQLEAAEAETLGAEEAARRRRQRERMLELRAGEQH
jgi:hypothetical protein